MAKETMPVGVVLERRQIDNPWQDYAWRPVAVIPGAAPTDEWRILARGEEDGKEWIHYQAGTLEIELHSGETEGYRVNLSNQPPMVYVAIQGDDEEVEHEMSPFLVTVCPYEAEGYAEGEDEIVEGVAMPDEILAWVGHFIDQHHVDVAFQKRRQKPKFKSGDRPGDRKAYDPGKGGFNRRQGGGGANE